jgi:hypothetical protein
MDKLFPLPEKSKVKDSTADKKLIKRHSIQALKRVSSLRDLTELPKPGQMIFLFTDKSFNAFSFVSYLLVKHQVIDELYLSTYSISKKILLNFSQLLSTEKIKKIELLVADSLKHQRPQVKDQLDRFAKNFPALSVKYAWNHSKMSLFKIGEHHYVVEGSGNWSENSRHEQYLFANDKELYEFRKECIQKAHEL